jgi:hypothetical protein
VICSRGKFHGFWHSARAEVLRPMPPKLAAVVARESRHQRTGWATRIAAAERRYGSGEFVGRGVAPRCGICGGALTRAWTLRHEVLWRLRGRP